MNESQKCMYKSIGAVLFVLVALAFTLHAEARDSVYIECYDCDTTNVTEVIEVTDVSNWSVTDSLSNSDINSIIAGTLAGGSHQFDWVTTRWQLSITAATNTSNWDEDSGFSFAIGKRFGKDSAIPNALWHLGYTPDIREDEDFVHGGATILLGGS